jgi:uncharacterized protein (DUF2384 family)
MKPVIVALLALIVSASMALAHAALPLPRATGLPADGGLSAIAGHPPGPGAAAAGLKTGVACAGSITVIYSVRFFRHWRWHPMSARTGKSVTAKAARLEGVTRGTAGYFDAEGLIVIDRVADRFGVSKAQLADTMGVSPETFHRAARARAPKTQGRAAEMIEIVARVSDWAGGEKQALAWYRAEPIPAFGGRTAESLVKDGKAAAVRDWLDHVATGGFA